MKEIVTAICFLLWMGIVANAQTMERVVFSGVASSDDFFQPVAGNPYGVYLNSTDGGLIVAAEYGENTIEPSGLITGEEELNEGNWRVYPSPALNILSVELPQSSTLQLFSSSGQLLLSEQASGMPYSLDMSTLSSGQYILRVNDSTGERRYKIMKK